jgi:nicotinamidase-related amidase
MSREKAPDFGLPKARTALLILDMFSDFDFPDGRAVLRAARRILPHVARLRSRARAAGAAIVYVNDNIGPWRSDFRGLLAHCTAPGAHGADIARVLAPADYDLVVLKPRHSGFYATPLGALLEQAEVRRVGLAGISTHQCILFTANDAYIRHLELTVPRDCVAAGTQEDDRLALKYLSSVLGADTREARRLSWPRRSPRRI